MTTLVVVSGLPGTGKTTLSRALKRALGVTCLRVDAVESSLVRAGIGVGPHGYEIVGELTLSNLLIGQDVIVDLVNPLPLTRSRWWDCADTAAARCVVFECVLPDEAEHRYRVEDRKPDISG